MSKSNPPLSFPAYVMDKLNDQQIQIDTLKNQPTTTESSFSGAVASVSDLPATGKDGDTYLVGDGDIYVWQNNGWTKVGDIIPNITATATSVPSTQSASVSVSGTQNDPVFNFSIPKGESPNLEIGTVSTSSSPSATITGTFPDLKLNLGLPSGASNNGLSEALYAIDNNWIQTESSTRRATTVALGPPYNGKVPFATTIFESGSNIIKSTDNSNFLLKKGSIYEAYYVYSNNDGTNNVPHWYIASVSVSDNAYSIASLEDININNNTEGNRFNPAPWTVMAYTDDMYISVVSQIFSANSQFGTIKLYNYGYLYIREIYNMNTNISSSSSGNSSSTSTITGSNLSADTIEAIQNIPTSASAPEGTIGYQKSKGIYTVATDYKYNFTFSAPHEGVVWEPVSVSGSSITQSTDKTEFTLASGRCYAVQLYAQFNKDVFPNGTVATNSYGTKTVGYCVQLKITWTPTWYTNSISNITFGPAIYPVVDGVVGDLNTDITNATGYALGRVMDTTINALDTSTVHVWSLALWPGGNATQSSMPTFNSSVPTFDFCKLIITEL
jgi:hypothetical protein